MQKEKEQEILKIKKDAEEKVIKETYNSILIAKKTLNSLSLHNNKIENKFKEFVKFNKPKNLINGDFLFLKKFDNIIFLAIFDATGSGVPAAFLRIFGYSQLDKIIAHKNIEANEILFKLKEIIIETFYSQDNDNTEGFDGAICKIDIEKREINYSGAQIPLYQITDNQIEIHKADRISINKNPFVDDNYMFKQKTFSFNENTFFYLTTDGYIDQLREQDILKFSAKNFKKTISKLQNNTTEEQIKIINETHNNWKKDKSQTDDILVVGFKI